MSYQPAGLDIATSVVAAVAAALGNRFHHPMTDTPLERRLPFLRLSYRLPRGWSSLLAAWATENRTHNRSLAFNLTTADLAQWNVRQYDSLNPERRFDTIVIGVPSGATAHLCACLGAPFLSDNFPITFSSKGNPDDIVGYQQRSVNLLTPILNRNSDLQAVSQFNPIHARMQAQRALHARLKLAALPELYKQFIHQRLKPGGDLLLLTCSAEWGQYEVGPRHNLQVGGFGGFSDQEFIRGTPWLDDWLESEGGSQRSGWRLSRHWRKHPEAQWGSLPGFSASVQTFASKTGTPLHSLAVSSINEISHLGFYAWQWLFYLLHIQPSAVLIESGPQINPVIGKRSPVLPLWLPSTCSQSHTLLQMMLPDFPQQVPILFQAWPTGHPAPDVISAKTWNATLSGRHGRWLGSDPRHFPTEFTAIAHMTPAIEEWSLRHPYDLPRSLRCEELDTLRSLLAEGTDLPGPRFLTRN